MSEAWAQLPPLPIPTTTTTEPEPSTTTSTTSTTAPPSPETTVAPPTESTLPPESVPTFTVPSIPGLSVPGTSTTTTTTEARVGAAPGSVADALEGASAIGFVTPVVVAGALTFLTARARPGRLRMSDPRRRLRLALAAACIAVAAIIGLVGWLKLSDEPQVNRQIPYLASAGMALVVLSAVGGSLLVAEQLRADDRRIEELEESVKQLAETLAPLVESPPRRR